MCLHAVDSWHIYLDQLRQVLDKMSSLGAEQDKEESQVK